MSQPNPAAERAELYAQLKADNPDASEDQLEEMMSEEIARHLYD